MYLSSVEGLSRKGKPLGGWKALKEYVNEKGMRGDGLEWTRRECIDRERWRSLYCGPLSFLDTSGGSEALELFIEILSYFSNQVQRAVEHICHPLRGKPHISEQQ